MESVQVGIKLPDTVNIEIKKEYEVAYAIRDQGGFWWRITSDGKVLEQVNGGQATAAPAPAPAPSWPISTTGDPGSSPSGVVTKPFKFEGANRMRQAEQGITDLSGKVDSLIIIPNDRLKYVTDQKITFANAFGIADDVLKQAVTSISELVGFCKNVIINLDFADVSAVMKNAGRAHMGVGTASGREKAEQAATAAVSSPLLETSINGATGVLVNVTGSSELTLDDVENAAGIVQQAANPNANIIFGATISDEFQDEMRVTVIATGFEMKPESFAPPPPVRTRLPAPASPALSPTTLIPRGRFQAAHQAGGHERHRRDFQHFQALIKLG